MTSKIILTDIDDTLLCFSDPFQDWLQQRGYDSDKRLREVYHINKLVDVTDEEGLRLIYEFSTENDAENMATLPPEPDALEIVPRLYREGFRFVAISACVSSPQMRQQRIRNLERVFGFPWRDVSLVGLRGSKEAHLHRYSPTYWVEDNHRHADIGAKLGHTAFLLDRLHNANAEPDVIRVDDWHQIAAIVTQKAAA